MRGQNEIQKPKITVDPTIILNALGETRREISRKTGQLQPGIVLYKLAWSILRLVYNWGRITGQRKGDRINTSILREGSNILVHEHSNSNIHSSCPRSKDEENATRIQNHTMATKTYRTMNRGPFKGRQVKEIISQCLDLWLLANDNYEQECERPAVALGKI